MAIEALVFESCRCGCGTSLLTTTLLSPVHFTRKRQSNDSTSTDESGRTRGETNGALSVLDSLDERKRRFVLFFPKLRMSDSPNFTLCAVISMGLSPTRLQCKERGRLATVGRIHRRTSTSSRSKKNRLKLGSTEKAKENKGREPIEEEEFEYNPFGRQGPTYI